MSELNNKINELRTLKKSYSDLADKVFPTSALLTELENGKQEIVDALNNKGIEASQNESLSTLAGKVNQISQEVVEFTAEDYSNVVSLNGAIWDIVKVGVEDKRTYAAKVVAEFYKESDTIELSGADAYATSDGAFYEASTTHTWDDADSEKYNRYVIYYYANNNSDYVQLNKTHDVAIFGDIHTMITKNYRRLHVFGTLKDIQCLDFCKAEGFIDIEEHNNSYVLNYAYIIQDSIVESTCKKINGGYFFNPITPGIIILDNLEEIESGALIGSDSFEYLNEANTDTKRISLKSLKVIGKNGYLMSIAKSKYGGLNFLNQLEELYLPELEYCHTLIYVDVATYGGGLNNIKSIKLPKLKSFSDTLINFYKFNTSTNTYCIGCQNIEMDSLESITSLLSNTPFGSDYSTGKTTLLSRIYMPSLKHCSISNLGNIFSKKTCNYLIDIEVGEMTSNLDCSGWNPVSIISDVDKIPIINKNIREHIASKVSDGNNKLTFKVSINLYNVLEQETLDAFAAKGWVVAGV